MHFVRRTNKIKKANDDDGHSRYVCKSPWTEEQRTREEEKKNTHISHTHIHKPKTRKVFKYGEKTKKASRSVGRSVCRSHKNKKRNKDKIPKCAYILTYVLTLSTVTEYYAHCTHRLRRWGSGSGTGTETSELLSWNEKQRQKKKNIKNKPTYSRHWTSRDEERVKPLT